MALAPAQGPQLLRRSPLVTALLVIYPIVIAVLIGFALSRGPSDPKVAFLNQIPEEDQFSLGSAGEDEFSNDEAKAELCNRVECIDVHTREEAEQKVRDGEAIAALVLPEDLIDKLSSLTTLNPEQPTVEVLVNEEDPVKGQLVDDRIQALITEANLQIAERVSGQAGSYIDILIEGGTFEIPLLGQTLEILGLDNSSRILRCDRGRSAEERPRSQGARAGDRVRRPRRREQRLRRAAAGSGLLADPGFEGGRLRRRRRRSTRSRSRSRRR